jgi:acyl carrier protein
VRELISLDYHHYNGDVSRRIAGDTIAACAGGPRKISAPDEEKTVDRESMVTFVIDWISKRTGYPTSSISPEMKLRDDLNLDSIKAGELAIVLSRKFGGTFTADSTSFANASLTALIDALHIDRAAPPDAQVPALKSEITLKKTGGLPDKSDIHDEALPPFDLKPNSRLFKERS